jgi:hypothetical protein
MKRIVLLIAFVAAAALCAGAQNLINFADMPIAYTPNPMPDLYPSGTGLNWDRFSYVTPGIWNGAGPGFWVDPATKHNTVAFTGGVLCNLKIPCTAMLKMSQPAANMQIKTFWPGTIVMSAGWQDNRIIIVGYNNGKFVGSVSWKLTTTPQKFTFPATWRVTQLAFTPDYLGNNAVIPQGSAVIYRLDVKLTD